MRRAPPTTTPHRPLRRPPPATFPCRDELVDSRPQIGLVLKGEQFFAVSPEKVRR